MLTATVLASNSFPTQKIPNTNRIKFTIKTIRDNEIGITSVNTLEKPVTPATANPLGIIIRPKAADTLAGKLMSDELDIIVWDSANISAKSEIRHKLDLRSGLSVALYTGHPFATRKYLKREELIDETILYMTPSGNENSLGDAHYIQLYEKAGFHPEIILKSNDLESVLIMVAAEQGISVLPSYCVEKLNNADNLVFITLEGEEEYEDIYMMWKENHNNSALECFLSFMNK